MVLKGSLPLLPLPTSEKGHFSKGCSFWPWGLPSSHSVVPSSDARDRSAAEWFWDMRNMGAATLNKVVPSWLVTEIILVLSWAQMDSQIWVADKHAPAMQHG